MTGFVLGDGEEKVAGVSGQFFVSADEVVVLADSRYRLQAQAECPDATVEDVYNDFPSAGRSCCVVRPLGAGSAGGDGVAGHGVAGGGRCGGSR